MSTYLLPQWKNSCHHVFPSFSINTQNNNNNNNNKIEWVKNGRRNKKKKHNGQPKKFPTKEGNRELKEEK
jgi:hypothetical protein